MLTKYTGFYPPVGVPLLGVSVVVAIRKQVNVDSTITARLVASLGSVTPKVAVETRTDNDVLLLELQVELHPIATDASVARHITIVDVCHNGEHHELLHLLWLDGSVHLATLSLPTCSSVLVVEGIDIPLPKHVYKDRLIRVWDVENLTETLHRVKVTSATSILVVARNPPEDSSCYRSKDFCHLSDLVLGANGLLIVRESLIGVSVGVLKQVA